MPLVGTRLAAALSYSGHAWWRDAMERLPSLRYHPVMLTANDARVPMEYTRRADDEQEMQVAEVPEIKDSLITASRVYHG